MHMQKSWFLFVVILAAVLLVAIGAQPVDGATSLIGGKLEFVVHFPVNWDWEEMHGQNFWTVVQWQDSTAGTWYAVEGWQGTFDSIEVSALGNGTYRGVKTWWVAPGELESRSFRWQVYAAEQDCCGATAPLATTDPFNLPANEGKTTVKVFLEINGISSSEVSYHHIPGFGKRQDDKSGSPLPTPVTCREICVAAGYTSGTCIDMTCDTIPFPLCGFFRSGYCAYNCTQLYQDVCKGAFPYCLCYNEDPCDCGSGTENSDICTEFGCK